MISSEICCSIKILTKCNASLIIIKWHIDKSILKWAIVNEFFYFRYSCAYCCEYLSVFT